MNLLDEFGHMVVAIGPACVLVENVSGIQSRGAVVFNRLLGLFKL